MRGAWLVDKGSDLKRTGGSEHKKKEGTTCPLMSSLTSDARIHWLLLVTLGREVLWLVVRDKTKVWEGGRRMAS